ncbi:flagellar biosynthesis anti-sigma factor FlgM [Qipengyuania sp. Mu-71]|jgi:negative regulator of flagellin synthesis FlgM|uniref:flagellar biosynthesis anti-sigma factor FlgM n=1 Tax=Qipengyuania sp. Mu-71 TaxID=3121477 RepID=UPI002FE4DDFE
MRIVGLPEFSGAVVRPGAAITPAGKVSPAQKVAAEAQQAEAPIATSRVSAGPEGPVDHDRVADIRKALETNSYPLIPTEIADAIIAAGMYGKVGK